MVGISEKVDVYISRDNYKEINSFSIEKGEK